MADEEILNIPPTADDGTIAGAALAPGEPADQSAGSDDVGSRNGGIPDVSSFGRRVDWSTQPLSPPKRLMEKRSYRAASRHANFGMTPRRFITLKESAPKPATPAPDPKKEAREARAARGVRRALWIIAIATAVNVGVAGLQWYELHRAYNPARQSVDAGGPVNRAALP